MYALYTNDFFKLFNGRLVVFNIAKQGAVITLPQQKINLAIFGFWHLGLSNERTSENKNAILDEFYRRLEAEFEKSPEDYKMELVVAVVNVKKA